MFSNSKTPLRMRDSLRCPIRLIWRTGKARSAIKRNVGNSCDRISTCRFMTTAVHTDCRVIPDADRRLPEIQDRRAVDPPHSNDTLYVVWSPVCQLGQWICFRSWFHLAELNPTTVKHNEWCQHEQHASWIRRCQQH